MFRRILLSLLLPLLVIAQGTASQAVSATQAAATVQPTPNTGYNGGDDNPVDPTDAGASGSDKGAFSLSKGGLVAIIVVAVIVVVGGTASAILFWQAKKRQWNVRQSIRRASRRLTGRSDVSRRQNRRTGMRLASPPPGKSARPVRDEEKGLPTASQQGKTTTTITSTFDVDTPVSKGWKPSGFGGKK